ncbi:MAG: hypothetical protein OEV78_07755 [Spirochaetia bacterium]|nr:hypothetical protein [Spirochaetia bacterium]
MKVLQISFLLFAFSVSSCEKASETLSKWQRDLVIKRYGLDPDKTKQIAEWEKEIIKYEDIINEKVEAGLKEAKLYRKIGEAYAGMEMYQPCVDNLQKAIDLGYLNEEIFFIQALCLGSLARKQNWEETYRNNAEAAFLKALSVNPDYHRAKLELGLLYFYGFGSKSKFSVNSEKIESSDREYREKGIILVKEYQTFLPAKVDGYLILAGMYSSTGKRKEAIAQLQSAVSLFRKSYPKDFEKREDYRQTLLNLKNLQGRNP